MTIHCFGSINIDHVHQVSHFPEPGETLADCGYAAGLGGKGANQALAAAAAGASVSHIGAVGRDGLWARDHLAGAGIDVSRVTEVDEATGHAVIYVSPEGENQIVIHGGANRSLTVDQIAGALTAAAPGDWWLCQNETNLVAKAAEMARGAGLKIAYAAAPFEAGSARKMLALADLIAVNQGEADALAAEIGCEVDALPVPALLVTNGNAGATLIEGSKRLHQPAFPVTPVDTTGAGDTFLGLFLAVMDVGRGAEEALRFATAGAALQVTRPGAAAAIPRRDEIDMFLRDAG
ncbi:MAG: ribokinase [Pseudomonadota bacterium]